MISPAGHLRLLPASMLVLLVACGDLREELPTAPAGAPAESLQQVPPGLQDFGPAVRAAERHTPALMRLPGVVGTGVGLDDSGEAAVKVFLVHEHVPGVPGRLDGVPVAQETTGMFTLRANRTERARPAPLGFSVGHPDVTAGTLGARVTDGTSVFILSNNHVLANSNNASLGDPILQPGAFDGGSQPDDVVGTLHDFQPISFSSNNTMDAAIALVDPNDVSGATPATEGYGAPGTSPRAAGVGMSVQKYGRTTGHTTGTVVETNVTVAVCFVARGPFCQQSATFVNQISISDGSFSAGGDSGSLIVDGASSNPRPVGLLFAGSSTRTIANPIEPVLQRFGVSIDPTVPDGSDPPPPPPPADGEVVVSGVTYTLSGGPQSNRHLRVHVALQDGAGNAVANAAVSAILRNVSTGGSWTFSGTTGSNGVVTFQVNNAPAGCYETEVTSVSAGGLDWDSSTPGNEVCK